MPRLLRRLAATLPLCLALIALSAGTATAAPGDLDTGFDADGAVFHGLNPEPNNDIRDPVVAQAPDGSLVAAVLSQGCAASTCEARTFNGFIRVIRVSPSGAVIDEASLSASSTGDIFDIRVLDDGTITIVGRRSQADVLVTRLDDHLDPLTDELSGGTYTPESSCESGERLVDAAIRPDGTIAALWNCGNATPRVELLDRQGEPVETFDGTGLGDDGEGGTDMAYATDLALSPTGVIHVLGTSDGQIIVARIAGATGELDETYDADGDGDAMTEHMLIEQSIQQNGHFAVDGEGRAVIGLWSSEGEWRFLRLTATGAIDEAGFGTEGVAEIEDPMLGSMRHITIQDDDKILVTGDETEIQNGRGGGADADGIVLARLLTNGAADTEFGSGGLVLLEVDDEDRYLEPVGPALQQSDGQIVVPAGMEYWGRLLRAEVTAPEESSSYLALFRVIGRIAALPGQRPQPQQQPQVQQQQQSTPNACVSNRRLRIRLRTGRRPHQKSRIVSAKVWVNGRRVKVQRRSGRRTATVNLRNLPKGRFAVKIRLRLADGGIVRETRRYRTCAPKVDRELKPLRTYPPKRG